jgi:hypothetical protein
MSGETNPGCGGWSRSHRVGAALIGSILMLALAPSFAGAAIKVYDSSAAMTYFGEVHKAKCKVKRGGNGTIFRARGRTTNGAYNLHVGILDFQGFGQTYNVPYGPVLTPTVSFEGVSNGADYDNIFAFPGGQPPGGAGAIAFAHRGAQLRLGIYALPNSDYSQGVTLAGGMKCGYPRR